MEKQVNPSLSLLTLLPEGKVESDYRIADKTVTGICTVYTKRTDNENEFLLREIGVAPFEAGNLTEAVQIAVSHARNAAICLIAGISPFAAGQPQLTVVKPPKEKATPEPAQPAPSPVNEAAGGDESKEAEVITPDENYNPVPPPVDLNTVLQAGTPATAEQAAGQQENNGGIEKIEFADNLFPESDFTDNPAVDDATDDADPEYQKALDMEITIFGKLHACNGWKAGKILGEQPDVIVDFCQRNSQDYDGPKYTGPRVDQKEALFKLYSEAMRKVQKAA